MRALEALEVGNQWEACEILLAALEDVDIPRGLACPTCELDDHLRVSHRFQEVP